MKIIYNLLLLITLITHYTTFYAQEEKSADLLQQQLILSFLPQETTGTRTARNSVQDITIDWDNIPKIERLPKLIAKKDAPVHEGAVSKEIGDKIGLLDETKTLQENFIHAVHNQEYKRVVNCLALEQYFNKNKKNINSANSLVQHPENSSDLLITKIYYMMCNDPEILLLVIQDRKNNNKKITDWISNQGTVLHSICRAHRSYNIFKDQRSSLNLDVIQILIDMRLSLNEKMFGFGTPLQMLCMQATSYGHMTTTSQRIKVAQMLLLAGADTPTSSRSNNTPLDCAKEDEEVELITFLENFTMPEPEPEVITFENEESFKDYMKNKPDSSN